MPIEDFGLSPEEQLRLHDLTEQAVSENIRQDPFGEPPTPDVDVPESPWTPVDTAPELSDSVLDEASTGFDNTVEEEDTPQQEEEIEEEQQQNTPSQFDSVDFNVSTSNAGASVDVEELNHELDGALESTQSGVSQEVLENTTAQAPGEESIITPNEQGVFTEDNTARFSSAVWYENIRSKTIILAGVGGIGSWTALLLGKLQPLSMFIYDNDAVEQVNMAGQLYSTDDIGKSKVDALSNTIKKYAAYNSVFAVNGRYDMSCEASDIMICGFDNMRARAMFFDKWKHHVALKPDDERSHCLFIDGRLAAEELQVFCITGDNEFAIRNYESNYLFSDSEAEATVCSYKQTAFVANMIAGIMVNLLVNFAANECNPPMPRSLPFKTVYNAEMMFFNTEEE